MREQTTSDAMADLDLIWHSVCDTKETNEAYKRLAALIAEREALLEALSEVLAVMPVLPRNTGIAGIEARYNFAVIEARKLLRSSEGS